jgi:AcrR family transcriptional regulator
MRKGELTRNMILDEAVTTARFTGLSGLTIGSLAARTDMSKSGLYAHFESKEALQLATMARNRDAFVTEVIRPALAVDRGEPRLRALIANWMRWYRHPGGCLFMSAATEFDDMPGPLHDQMISDERDLHDSIKQVLGTLVTTGEAAPDMDTEQVSQEIFGILLACNWRHRIIGDARAEAYAWTAVDRLLAGLRP